MYPVVAAKSIEEWYRIKQLEFAITLIATNPESAKEIADYYIERLNIK